MALNRPVKSVSTVLPASPRPFIYWGYIPHHFKQYIKQKYVYILRDAFFTDMFQSEKK